MHLVWNLQSRALLQGTSNRDLGGIGAPTAYEQQLLWLSVATGSAHPAPPCCFPRAFPRSSSQRRGRLLAALRGGSSELCHRQAVQCHRRGVSLHLALS